MSLLRPALSLLVAPVACLLGAALSVADVPAVDELEKRMTEAAEKVDTFEADVTASVVETDGSVRKGEQRIVSERTRKDGKETVRDFESTRMGANAPGAQGPVTERKIVNDGVFAWHEERNPQNGPVKVTKCLSHGRATSVLAPAEMLKSLQELRDFVKVEGITLVEDTLDGRKMYILAGTINLGASTVTGKYWIDQESLLFRREVRIQAHKEDGNAPRTSVVTIDFLNVKVNQKVDPKLFQYTPPADAVITDETKPKP